MGRTLTQARSAFPTLLVRSVFTHGAYGTGGHEEETHRSLAARLASLLDLPFGGDCEMHDPLPVSYLIPRATLSGRGVARKYGICCELDLLGGWVPRGWMGTKAIMHPLLPAAAVIPPEWPSLLAQQAEAVTLRGYTTFSAQDARQAGRQLLAGGPVRLKPVGADGGRGQLVARSEPELDIAIDALCVGGRLADIVTLEENLEEAVTYSVGQLRLNGFTISYCGTQTSTQNADGDIAYGGSDLLIARGCFHRLLSRHLPEEMREAVEHAVAFDKLADQHIPGLIASRRNYDVISGLASNAIRKTGVLEQSWRIGGATGAEVAALEVFSDQPRSTAVRARTVETYEENPEIPSNATLHYQGAAPGKGRLTKYACVDERLED